jgi:hypothetical protein
MNYEWTRSADKRNTDDTDKTDGHGFFFIIIRFIRVIRVLLNPKQSIKKEQWIASPFGFAMTDDIICFPCPDRDKISVENATYTLFTRAVRYGTRAFDALK